MFERFRKIDPVFIVLGVLLLIVWAVLIPLLLR
jgi:hypothetical protein